jgi:hypothetical protein
MHAKPHSEEKARAAARSAGPTDNYEYSDEKVDIIGAAALFCEYLGC